MDCGYYNENGIRKFGKYEHDWYSVYESLESGEKTIRRVSHQRTIKEKKLVSGNYSVSNRNISIGISKG